LWNKITRNTLYSWSGNKIIIIKKKQRRQCQLSLVAASRPVAVWWGLRCSVAFTPVTHWAAKWAAAMEILIFRILLLVVLFIMLTGDYTTFFSHIVQRGTAPTHRDPSRTTSKSSDEEDADDTQLEDALELYCECFTWFVNECYQCMFHEVEQWISTGVPRPTDVLASFHQVCYEGLNRRRATWS